MSKAVTERLSKMLYSWTIMNRYLSKLSLKELQSIYEIERKGENRMYMKLRLHQRHNRLRFLKEQEIIKKGKDVELQPTKRV